MTRSMPNQEFKNLANRWAGDLTQLSKEWAGELQEAAGEYISSLMEGAFSPERFLDFIRESRLDFTGILRALESQPPSDPYRILGLDRSASDSEVKKRYRALVHRLHPDTSGTETTSCLLQLVLAAYEAIKKERGWQ